MREQLLSGLDAADPLGFLAGCGILRIVAKAVPEARMAWTRDRTWQARLLTPEDVDLIDLVERDIARWREGSLALEFAVRARQEEKTSGKNKDKRARKRLDLKHPPAEFRALLRELAADEEGAAFGASYATGVAVDSTGQTKPTSFHFAAGGQVFLSNALELRDEVGRDDLQEALYGPWVGRKAGGLRWRGGAEPIRALLSYNPGDSGKKRVIVGAEWLAFQALPLFPCAPRGLRVTTTGFTGRGKQEAFTWPVWEGALSVDAVRVLVGTRDLATKDSRWREARGVAQVLQSAVERSGQGYGNFGASKPCLARRPRSAPSSHAVNAPRAAREATIV